MREVGPKRSSTHDAGCWSAYADHSNMNHIRFMVEQRDKGVCKACGLDTEKLKAEWHKAVVDQFLELRKKYDKTYRDLYHSNVHYSQAVQVGRFSPDFIKPPDGFPIDDRRWWEMDHIIPVVEGGGGCDFNGYRTLCIPCHKAETAALAARRAAKRKAEKQKPAP